ncbi:MAG: fibronectin type III domain-containing protein [bacterium]|nr:fibronectin type III domain-containing protein [bacterium]
MSKKKLFSIISLVVFAIALTVGIFLVGQQTGFFSEASPEEEPKDIKVTNISDNSFSVSWLTPDKVTAGFLVYGETEKLGSTASDDRDRTGQTSRFTHHTTVKNLDPSTLYYFKIGSGKKAYDDDGENFSISTAPTTTDPPAVADPAYGKVLDAQGAPVADALVYLTIAGGTPLSSYTRADGNWLITLNNARTSGLSTYIKYKPQGDTVDFFVNANGGTTKASADTNNVRPMQTVKLGQVYVFGKQGETAKVTPTSPPKTQAKDFSLQQISNTTESAIPLEILAPSEDSTVSTTRPTFTGTGTPGEVVTITINSTQQITTTVTIGADGKWSYTPTQDLEAGNHSVLIAQGTSTDKANFSVLGTSTTTVTASPTPTPASLPVAGRNDLVYFFLGGFGLVVLGSFVLFSF